MNLFVRKENNWNARNKLNKIRSTMANNTAHDWDMITRRRERQTLDDSIGPMTTHTDESVVNE